MRAIVFLNGDYSKQTCELPEHGDLIVAVDGGAKYLLDNSIVPHIFVGDADSIERDTLEKLQTMGCKIYLYPQDKDKIDAQLAIEKALELGASQILIRGWQGERIDMILALIYVMCKYSDFRIIAKDDNLEMGVIRTEAELEACAGEKWSILPICGDATGITLEGFKYPLTDANMFCHEPFGVSNTTLTGTVRISVKKGMVVYFRWIKEPL
ncbi:MAG: thiamine diphosphokinase [Pseudothermotoga sp.]|nr:thiamine diphosphokinase [Pseudothermotoga sp.]